MSRKANPSVIGAFVLAGIGLIIVSLLFLGTIDIFQRKETYILYFRESVNGLAVGSGVKWKGVPIGRVSEIMIRYNQYDRSASIPVFVEIDIDRIMRAGVDEDITDPEYLAAAVEDGLRAQLVMDSLITGLLYVELDYHVNAPRPTYEQEPTDNGVQVAFEYLEIPTIPSSLAGLDTSLNEALVKLAAVDYQGISNELLVLLRNANDTLEAFDFERLNNSLIETAQAAENLLNSPTTQDSILTANRALQAIERLANTLESRVGPMEEELRDTLAATRDTLVAYRRTADQATALLSPESPTMYELEHALNRLAAASESIRLLADYLERNPSALLSGKQSGTP